MVAGPIILSDWLKLKTIFFL